MYYLYFLANASLTLRVAEYLRQANDVLVEFMTVIHQIDGWIVKVKLCDPVSSHKHLDFLAYMNELGIPYEPDIRLQMALWSLETGQSAIEVMRRYQVTVVAHGNPDKEDIEAFRRQFARGLGYCPETLA